MAVSFFFLYIEQTTILAITFRFPTEHYSFPFLHITAIPVTFPVLARIRFTVADSLHESPPKWTH